MNREFLKLKTIMSRFILLLTLIIPLSSCLTFEQMTVTEIKDYSPLTDKGIFVTEANNVNFDYTPIGSVVSITRGAIDTFGGYAVNIDTAFDDIAKELLNKGANGLINLDITSSYLNNMYYTTITGMAIRTKEPLIKPANIEKKTEAKSSVCVIDGIKALIIQRRPSGIFVSTSQKMSSSQIVQMIEELHIANKAVQIFLSNGGDKAYAGVTDNGYYINYETKEFIELSKINSTNSNYN